MLQALLLAALVAAPLGSAALFVPARLIDRGTGAWSAVRRFMLAVIGTAVLAAAAAGVLRLLGATEHNLVAGAALHLPVRYHLTVGVPIGIPIRHTHPDWEPHVLPVPVRLAEHLRLAHQQPQPLAPSP